MPDAKLLGRLIGDATGRPDRIDYGGE